MSELSRHVPCEEATDATTQLRHEMEKRTDELARRLDLANKCLDRFAHDIDRLCMTRNDHDFKLTHHDNDIEDLQRDLARHLDNFPDR